MEKPAVCTPVTHCIYYSTKYILIVALDADAEHTESCHRTVKPHRKPPCCHHGTLSSMEP